MSARLINDYLAELDRLRKFSGRVPDQHKENGRTRPAVPGSTPIADYQGRVIDLLARFTTVSVRTVAITEAMTRAPR